MSTNDFMSEIDELSKSHKGMRLYPYTDREKLYGRFTKRIIIDCIIELVTKGWLGDLYLQTNGVDLNNYYIVPFNNYFNKKKLPFERFYSDWIRNQNNPNEILGQFCAFMTNGKKLIGYLEDLTDCDGSNFIGIAQGRPVGDVLIIASSIYKFYDFLIDQLKTTGKITISEDETYWRQIDPELDRYYNEGKIVEYKLRYLYQNDSIDYRKHCKEE